VDSDSQLSGCAKRLIQETLLQKLCSSLLKDAVSVSIQKVYHVSLPTLEAHSGNEVGINGGFTQRAHPEVIQHINELVLQSITDSNEVRRALRFHVIPHLCKNNGIQPSDIDHSFFPALRDIQHCIYKAKSNFQH